MKGRSAVLRRFTREDAQRATGRRSPLRSPEWLRVALADGAAGVSPDVAWTAWVVVVAVVCMAGALAGGPGLALVAAVAVSGAPLLALRGRRGRALQVLEGQLPSGLEAVARALRSGASLRQAVGEAASCGGVLGADLAAVAAECGQGIALIDALERWQARRRTPGVRLAVAALSLSAETGGAQARAVDGVAATMRDRLAVAAEVRAHAAQVRASVLVISLAPIGFCAFASATDPRTSTFLFRTPLGWGFLAAGLSLDAVSAVWMRRLARVSS
jgi:tight adherence protein B